jgi:hypothetical protein
MWAHQQLASYTASHIPCTDYFRPLSTQNLYRIATLIYKLLALLYKKQQKLLQQDHYVQNFTWKLDEKE